MAALAVTMLLLAESAFCAADAATNGASADAPASAPASPAWRFRIGPFFDIGRDEHGVEVSAVRPLYSRVSDDSRHESITDVVWPWSSFHHRDAYSHWWAFPAFGKDENIDDPLSRHTFWLLPIYCEGRTRDGDTFAALFPVGGDVRDFLWLDEVRFVLFPFYVQYRQGRQEGESVLWPVYGRETGPLRDKFRLFPIYGETTNTNESDRFLFWPFWTDQVFNGPKKHGTAEMLWPVYGRVDTDKQQGWLALPPFFSRMKTDGQTQLRCPWPFYERTEGKERQKRSCWPLWDQSETPTGERRSILWPFWWDYRSENGGRREADATLVPFYHQAESARKVGGQYVTDMSYLRVWPFFSRYATGDGTRLRLPELTFMRDGQGIERNWAPFWSLYVRQEQGAACDHDVLWGLARWGQRCDHTGYGQVGPLVSWSRPPQGRLSWSVLGGLAGREDEGGVSYFRWLWWMHSGAGDGREPRR